MILLTIHAELVDDLLNLRGSLKGRGFAVNLGPVLLPTLERRPGNAAGASRVAFFFRPGPFGGFSRVPDPHVAGGLGAPDVFHAREPGGAVLPGHEIPHPRRSGAAERGLRRVTGSLPRRIPAIQHPHVGLAVQEESPPYGRRVIFLVVNDNA